MLQCHSILYVQQRYSIAFNSQLEELAKQPKKSLSIALFAELLFYVAIKFHSVLLLVARQLIVMPANETMQTAENSFFAIFLGHCRNFLAHSIPRHHHKTIFVNFFLFSLFLKCLQSNAQRG